MSPIDSYEVGAAMARAIQQAEEQHYAGATVIFLAAPHKWGTGKVHLLDMETSNTRCGQDPLYVPGEIAAGHIDSVTCLICVKSHDAERKRKQRDRKWAEKSKTWNEDRAREDREWRERYNDYLLSDAWRERRQLVLRRDQGICQGCLKRDATQVHHLSYRDVGDEMLFNLVAICDACHAKIHGRSA